MSNTSPHRKLGFPGILDKQAKVFRERLLAVERTARKNSSAPNNAAVEQPSEWDAR
jgi:hypothetical protein